VPASSIRPPIATRRSAPRGRPLRDIETWIFDLDNTLYPSSCNLFAEAEARMARFIVEELRIELDIAAAHALRRRFFLDHGTTLRGLMLEHGIEPRRFLDYVHDIDLTPVKPDPALAAAIAALPGRKFVFTNGTDDYARRILERIGIGGLFAAIHDITACAYCPKPDPSGYRAMVERYGIDPSAALMVEDMARNLPPAAALGMTTAWIRTQSDWARQGCEPAHIHHVVDELAPWLAGAARKPE
jgi:putative hydrolase of the HAD superfamily